MEIIDEIVNKHKILFGSKPIIKKINIGFTNTIYSINEKYIVKICTNHDNEENFKNEIEFYNNNKFNKNIPKLYYSCINKKEIIYFYEIIEKISGVSLYSIWHKLDEKERQNTIKKLCKIIKSFHKKKYESYNWSKYLKERFVKLYLKANELKVFNKEDKETINDAFSKFDDYLFSDDFVLVHNDLHFDNIFYNNGEIKIIDFERVLIAPRDFELDIYYRMIRNPIKFASEEEEKYIKESDYLNIIKYTKEYYPKLFDIPNLEKRLAIYDMVYYMEQIIEYPHLGELKMNILNASKIVL
jgi:serine/threonine protein kinase